MDASPVIPMLNALLAASPQRSVWRTIFALVVLDCSIGVHALEAGAIVRSVPNSATTSFVSPSTGFYPVTREYKRLEMLISCDLM